MSPDRRPRIGITLGDPAGIGPEVVAAALAHPVARAAELRVYGDCRALERCAGAAIPNDATLIDTASAEVSPGKPDPAAAAGTVEAIRRAARDCLDGALDALATAPISKEVIARAGFPWPGHTELLEEICGSGHAVMLLAGGRLKVALVTIHCALREVPGRLSREAIGAVLDVLQRDLVRLFAIAEPRIAVCGLNPHAGDGGRFGDEEARLIAPAITAARQRGIAASGPFAADSLFGRAIAGDFDAVLAMYHDQGLGPLKTHASGRAINVTLGLPIVRTSADHGTAFDIAGRERANPGSMIEALRWAIDLSSNREHARHNEREHARGNGHRRTEA